MNAGLNVLLTGANGFLGKHLLAEMSNTCNVDTLGRSASTYNADLSTTKVSFGKGYDLVVHAAGKAHSVPATDLEAKEFFDVNVSGTMNLLQSLEKSGSLPAYFLFISSVSVYGLESGEDITEEHPLDAIDAYGKSKIMAERLIEKWCDENNVVCSILRLPLIAASNPPGNLQSMITSIKRGYYFDIAGGKARKSIVLAEDVAKLILKVATIGGTYNLTDGHNPSFSELSALIATQLQKPKPLNMPYVIARLLGCLGDLLGKRAPVNSLKICKITSSLTFSDAKARINLGWHPAQVLGRFHVL